jgi:hypothetical protein
MRGKDTFNTHSTKDGLSKTFQFRITVDSDFYITYFCDELKKIVPDISNGDPLKKHFQAFIPIQSLECKHFATNSDNFWVLHEIATGLKLRGKILLKPLSIDFLISPWLNVGEELD